MLSETAVAALLTASITGAGLIIAIYALITPISRKIFDDKVALLHVKKKEFDKLKVKVSSDSSDEEFEHLKKLAAEIKKNQNISKISWDWRYFGFHMLLRVHVSLCFVARILKWKRDV